MTKGRVDLAKATTLPAFKKELPPYIRVMEGSKVNLEAEVRGSVVIKGNHAQKYTGTTQSLFSRQLYKIFLLHSMHTYVG